MMESLVSRHSAEATGRLFIAVRFDSLVVFLYLSGKHERGAASANTPGAGDADDSADVESVLTLVRGGSGHFTLTGLLAELAKLLNIEH